MKFSLNFHVKLNNNINSFDSIKIKWLFNFGTILLDNYHVGSEWFSVLIINAEFFHPFRCTQHRLVQVFVTTAFRPFSAWPSTPPTTSWARSFTCLPSPATWPVCWHPAISRSSLGRCSSRKSCCKRCRKNSECILGGKEFCIRY